MSGAIKNRLKAIWARVSYDGGTPATYAPHGSIVLFHRVHDAYAGDPLTVSRLEFDRYLRLFKTYFDVISLSTFVSDLAERKPLAGKLAITFDDGYLDNHQFAAPLLARYRLPCAFFVATSFVGSKTPPFWDRRLPTPPEWMTWDHVQELHREGFEIGSHTSGHVDLGTTGSAEARRELTDSKRELESRLGAPVHLFSYPFGGPKQMSEANLALVKEAGYRACFSAFGGVVPSGTDVYRIRRHPISDYHTAPWMYMQDLEKQHRLASGAYF